MNRRNALIAMLIVFFVSMSASTARAGLIFSSHWLELHGGMDKTDLSGQLAVTDEGVLGTSLDTENDLNLDDDEALRLGAILQLPGGWGLRASYRDHGFEGRSTLTRTVNYGGESFTLGSQVQSDMDIAFYDVDLTYRLVDFWGVGVLDLQLGLRGLDVDATIREVGGATSSSESLSGGVPVIGIHTRLYGWGPFENFYVDGRLEGVDVSVQIGDEADLRLVDGEISLGYSLLPMFDLQVGYRSYQIDGTVEDDDQEIDADLEFDSWNASLVWGF